jgi:hypothetical protein
MCAGDAQSHSLLYVPHPSGQEQVALPGTAGVASPGGLEELTQGVQSEWKMVEKTVGSPPKL